MRQIEIEHYLERSSFVSAISRRLDSFSAANILLTKISPSPFQIHSGFSNAIANNLRGGGEFTIISPNEYRAWLEEWLAFLPRQEHINVTYVERNAITCSPVLIINDSDVFIHLSWPDNFSQKGPYIGLHVINPPASTVCSLREAILQIVISNSG